MPMAGLDYRRAGNESNEPSILLDRYRWKDQLAFRIDPLVQSVHGVSPLHPSKRKYRRNVTSAAIRSAILSTPPNATATTSSDEGVRIVRRETSSVSTALQPTPVESLLIGGESRRRTPCDAKRGDRPGGHDRSCRLLTAHGNKNQYL